MVKKNSFFGIKRLVYFLIRFGKSLIQYNYQIRQLVKNVPYISNQSLPVPGIMEFSTHNFLKKIRLVAYAIFHGNRLLEKSVDPAEASFRRLYLLSLFSALSLEYLRLSDLGTTTGTLGPLQLPFKGIGSAAYDSVLVEGNLNFLTNANS